MLLGEDFDAHRALASGMVNKVVPTGEEEAHAQAWAKILANSAPLVVQGLQEFSLATLNKSPAEAGACAPLLFTLPAFRFPIHYYPGGMTAVTQMMFEVANVK